MKIGVISDTHIANKQDTLPQEIIEAFKDVDMIIHAGDITDISLLDKLRKICKNVTAVCGNMDPEETRKQLPEKEIIKAGDYRIGIAHGCGHPSKIIELAGSIFKDDDVDIIIFGHSHSPVNERRNGVLYFNPGSPLDKVFAPCNSYGIIEINGGIKAEIVRL